MINFIFTRNPEYIRDLIAIELDLQDLILSIVFYLVD